MMLNAWWLSAMLLTLTGLSGDAPKDTYRVSEAEVVVVCPLTVGGSFEAKTKDISGDVAPDSETSGAIAGTIRVNLQSLETGIGLRDRHMRSNYLEVEKESEFAVAILDGIHLDALQGKSAFQGMLTLPGQRPAVKGTAEVSRREKGYRVHAEFPIRVSDFQIPVPLYLGIGVRDEVRVKVTFVAAG